MLNNPWIYLPAPNIRRRCFRLEFAETNNRTIYYILLYIASEYWIYYWTTKLKKWWVQIISNLVVIFTKSSFSWKENKNISFSPGASLYLNLDLLWSFFKDFCFAAAQMHRVPGGKGAECQRADGCCRWSRRIRWRAWFISCQAGREPDSVTCHSSFLPTVGSYVGCCSFKPRRHMHRYKQTRIFSDCIYWWQDPKNRSSVK